MANKRIDIIGGGTVYHIRNHLALCAPAYGKTAVKLAHKFLKVDSDIHGGQKPTLDIFVHLTKMAQGRQLRDENLFKGATDLETNEDVSNLVDKLIADMEVKIVVMTAALCDYEGYVSDGMIPTACGKYAPRLHSRTDKPSVTLSLLKGDKIIGKIRKKRKDIFLVACKTTCGATPDEQYIAGLTLCKEASANLVLANDTKTRLNMVITPEEARYHVTTDRDEVLLGLAEMTLLRSHLTFTRSTVVAGTPVAWDSPDVPATLRAVVDHCIKSNAYKPFRGSTVGHFACKVNDEGTEFLTSIRKSNFNDLATNGLVRVMTDGPDSVVAYGAKPSVGGQSQRIVFHDHKEYDCILHFHCPLLKGHKDDIPVASQREFECGSHECGKNTSSNLKQFGNLSCVMLDQHGPNIVFHRSINPQEVIDFIEANFDLAEKTGGHVSA